MRDNCRQIIVAGAAWLCCFATALFALPASAGANRWTAIGPDGANIVALAIDPLTPSTTFAGTLGSGILKSTDGGASWATANAGLPTANVSALAIDPSTPSTIFAGTDAGIFKSTDDGQSWVAANGALPGASHLTVSALAIASGSLTTLYAVTSAGLFKTVDGAASWTPINAGSGPYGSSTRGLIAIDPTSPSTIYVEGLEFGVGLGYGIYKSTNAGTSWSRIYNVPDDGEGGSTLAAIAIDPGASSRLYLAFFYGDPVTSSDAGASWSPISSPPGAISSLAVDPTSSTLYAGTWSGAVFRSTDAGSHWSPALVTSHSQAPPGINVIALTAAAPATVYAGGDAGIFRSTDRAETWMRLTLGVRIIGVSVVAVDPNASSTMYADANGVLVKTTDGGAHWAEAGLALSWVESLLIDPASPSTLYVSGGLFGASSGLYKSADAGAHWTSVLNGPTVVQALAIAPSRSSTLYVGQALVGVLKSVDGGASWAPFNNGLTAIGPYVTALAVDPMNADIVFAATSPTSQPTKSDGKIFRSTDGAALWKQVLAGLPWITSIAIDPTTPANVYAASADGGVLKSTDRGETWTVSYLPGWGAHALAIDPSSPSQIYAATQDGVFKSTDGATSWSSFNSGLPTNGVWNVAIDRTGSLLRAASTAGLFEYRVSSLQSPTTVPLIEYFHVGFGHYFITSSPDEITKLNNGTLAGWRRTGSYFNAYPTSAAGASPVCRFVSTAFAQKSSHFHTPFASECATVRANPDWVLEDAAAFYAIVPASDGSCPADFVPVYRLYNNGQGGAPNHRYITDFNLRAQMLADGWILEGLGADGVEMCAPR